MTPGQRKRMVRELLLYAALVASVPLFVWAVG